MYSIIWQSYQAFIKQLSEAYFGNNTAGNELYYF